MQSFLAFSVRNIFCPSVMCLMQDRLNKGLGELFVIKLIDKFDGIMSSRDGHNVL